MLFVLGIIIFLGLVVVHEYGHFLVAKRNGVEVEEFGIGFPPKIAGKKLGKGIFRSYYTINLLPFGGFVRLKGENDADKTKGSFGAATLWSKVKIMMAGVFMNLITAVILLSIVAAVRLPVAPSFIIEDQFTVDSDTQILRDEVVIAAVGKGSPAEKAGLEDDDVIVSINDTKIKNESQLTDITNSNAGKKVSIELNRNGKTLVEEVTLNKDTSKGALGIAPQRIFERKSTWSAPIVGTVVTYQLSEATLRILGQTVAELFRGQTEVAKQNVGGPVLIVASLLELKSMSQLLYLMGIISLTLAIMNALPIPAVDGGRLFVTLLFRAIKKPLTPKIENAIHGTGFILLLGLAVLVTILDIGRIT